MSYETPEEIASRAKKEMKRAGDSQKAVAERLKDGSRSAVSHALNEPSTRRITTLRNILELYGYTVDTKNPMYEVTEDDSVK
jgi:transcriptional regulator with XRE-family HTH domain